MRKPLSFGIGVVVLAAGFAGASIIAGGSIGAILSTTVVTTASTPTTTTTSTTTTSTTPGGRGVQICWRRQHFGRYSTVIVGQQQLRGYLRRGGRLGPCIPVRPVPLPVSHHGGHGDDGGWNGFGNSGGRDSFSSFFGHGQRGHGRR